MTLNTASLFKFSTNPDEILRTMKNKFLFCSIIVLSLTSNSLAASFRKGFYVNRPLSNLQQLLFTVAGSKINSLTTTLKTSCTARDSGERSTNLVTFGGNDFRPITITNNAASGTVRVNKNGERYRLAYSLKPDLVKITLTTNGGASVCTGFGKFRLSFAAVEPSKEYENDSNSPDGGLILNVSGNTVTSFSASLVGTCNYNEAPYNIALVGYTIFPGSGQTLPISGGRFELVGVNTTEFDSSNYNFSSTYNSGTDSWTTRAIVIKTNSVGICTFNGNVVSNRN